MISYKNPKVTLFDDYTIDNTLCYDLWLKSREHVISKDKNGNLVVGTEVIEDQKQYMNKVMRMGLQYSQFSTYVFEIEGSILFRDILFTLNELPSWAVSLRFINSTFDEFDPSNYPVSSEYAGMENWEDQLHKYFDKMKETMVTDENRFEMPYSMHSKYWISFDWKTLVGFLSMLKLKMPFFYEIYGRLFEKELLDKVKINISEYYTQYIDSCIGQYFFNHQIDNFNESFSLDKDSGVVILKKEMGMLLFSQFIRQKNSRIKGLFDLICNTNPEEVIYAGTPVRMMYTGDNERFMRTVSNRTCWFSMSSGNNINSWSSILDLVLKDVDVNEFEKLIPCTVDKNNCVVCKYHEDVKFRCEGIETRNLPCGLAVMISDIIEKRNNYDGTRLSELYLELYDKWNSQGVLEVQDTLIKKFKEDYCK